MNKYLIQNLRHDLPAGLVVFLVALPLCLGIAFASGAPPFSGIIAGIVGGLVVGVISGSQLSVSGPAAGLTVIVINGIQNLGSFELLTAAVLVAGLIQILLGLLRLGILGSFFPVSVIKGMLAAIGLILILKQIPHFVGYDADFEGDESFMLKSSREVTDSGEKGKAHNTFLDIWYALQKPTIGALLIGSVSMLVMLIWSLPLIQRNSFLKLIPAALLAVITGLVMNLLYESFFPSLMLSNDHLVQVPVFSSWDAFTGTLAMPDFSRIGDSVFWVTAITLAVIASIESLLSIDATDKLDPQKRITPLNRELIAQGSGNIVSGLLGGLPVTAVIVRSSANIAAGGKTKISAVSHGFLLLIAVVSVPTLLNKIPLSSLAAVLMMVGYKLTTPKLYVKTFKDGVSQFLPFLVTIIAILFTDLLIGISIGTVLGLFFVFKTNFRSAILMVKDGNNYLIRFKKDVSFLNKSKLRSMLLQIPNGSHVIIDSSRSVFLDHDIDETIRDFMESAKHKDITIEIKNK